MPFMSAITTRFDGIDCHISRSGYTGEDGYEISCKATRVRAIVERLLSEPSVKLIGLGARDSLRLEAGLCLYGHDIDTTTSPVEAALTWSIGKRRRDRRRLSRRRAHPARDRGRPGAPARRHQAGRPRARARRHRDHARPRASIGKVTSGGFGPSVNGPIAMGYVERAFAAPGTAVQLDRARQADAGEHRRAAVRAAPLRSLNEGETDDARATPRTTNGSASTAMSPPSASPSTRRSQLGDIVYVELPEIGRKVEKGGEAAVVELVKAASDVYAPASGEVVAVNESLDGAPATINEDAEGKGWFFRLKLAAPDELERLMTDEQYKEFLATLDTT